MIMKRIFLPVIFGFIGFLSFSETASAFSIGSDIASSFSTRSYQDFVNPVSSVQRDGEKARETIERMGEKAISFLRDDNLSLAGKEKKFRQLLHSNFDMATIGRFALGRNWRVATAKQKKEYLKLFENLVVKVYSSRFNDYEGQKFDVDSFRNAGKKDIIITSYIVPNTGSKVKVDWRVRNKGGRYKIVDVIIEGVSMAVTQRSDFASVIQRGGGSVEVLLDHLRK